MDDLVERLREPNGTDGMSTRRIRKEAADRIEALQAQLEARDAEIAAWLRGEAGILRSRALVPASYLNAEAAALEKAATAIEAGEYRKDRDHG